MINGEIIEPPIDHTLATQIVKDYLDRLPQYRFGELVFADTGERHAMIAVHAMELVDLVEQGMINVLARQN